MSIQVTACLNPFSQERKDFNFEQGISIQKIINKIDALHAVNTGWRVMIDDEIITDFERIPEEGQRVYLKLVPENDSPKDTGAGMKVGGAALAVLGVILCFTPVAPLGAALVGAGIGMFAGGMALYNINIPDVNMNDREKPEQDPSIRGSRNQMRPYGVVPVLLGRRRIYADQCANPYTWVDDDGGIWLYQLFCVGQKDLQIETDSIKIEETLLKNYSATGDIARILDPENPDPLIQMQIAYGGMSSPLYNKCVHEIQLNTLLKHETEDGQDGAIIRTTPDGTTELNVDIFFYSGLGKYNDSGDVVNTSVEVKVEYKRSNLPDSQYALLGYFNEVDQNNVITGCNLKTRRLALTLDHLIASAYTVRITRVSADSTDSKIIDSVYVGSIRAAKNESPVRAERCQQITQIGLKIKASEKLNNVIEQLNFIAQSKLPVYQNGQWTNALSSNPASAAMYAMQGDVAQQKLSDSEIETEAFSKLFTWCNNHGYSCNAYVTESLTVNDLLARIASTCRAEILRMNGKITVIQDIEKDSFVQLFTPRNSHDYKETMALAEIPDEMKMGFVDSSKGFADNEAHVYNTPSGNQISGVEPQTSQSVPLWGVTNSEQARKLGMYNYAVSKHRFVIVRFSCDFEYLMCRKGDWIKYAGDIALAGLKQGRIESVDGQKILLDEQVTMESGKTYAVRIRKSDGSAVLCNVQTVAGGTNELTITEQMPSGIEGCLFAFGITGNETVDLLVTDIQCGENLSADLICVEYAPEIFGVDNPDFVLPDFVNHLSEVDSVIEPADVSEWRTFSTYNDSEVTPSTPTGGGTSGDWHLQQTENSKWISTKTAASIYEGEWSAPMPTGKKVMDLLVPDGEIGNPDSVDDLAAVANRDAIYISWSAIRDNGLNNSIKCYILKISKDNGVSWSDPIYLTDCSYEYFFTRTGQGSDGYPEVSALANWKVKVVAENIYGKVAENWTVENVNTSSYGTWIPATLSFDAKIPDEGGITFSWSRPTSSISGRTLYGTPRYTVTIKYADSEHSVSEQTFGTLVTSAQTIKYNFDRDLSKDGYPEKVATASYKGLDKYTFILSVENESGNLPVSSSAVTFTPSELNNYKTWIPSAPVITKKIAEENGITFEWNDISDCYGNNHYTIVIPEAEGIIPQSLGATRFYYTFLRESNGVLKDGYPEPGELIDWDFTVKAVNNQTSRESTGSVDYVDVSEYLGWLPNAPVVQSRSSGRTCTVSPTNAERRYGKIMYKIMICNPAIDREEDEGDVTYKYYLPTPTADPFGAETNYKNASQENVPILSDSPYSQTMPLKDQAATKFKKYSFVNADDPLDYDNGTMKLLIYTETQPPATATQNDVYIDGVLIEDAYCWTDSGTNFISFEVSMPSPKDTMYWWKIASYNAVTESLQSKTSAYTDAQTTAFATSAFDVVKAGITENALAPDAVTTDKIAAGTITANKIFVEALSAISANLGAITDGSLVGNANNYWYLSDEYNEQHQLIHRAGDFRVGGATGDFISCSTSNGTDYNIEIQASQFNITAIGTVVKGAFYVAPSNATINPTTGIPSSYYARIDNNGVSISGNVSIDGSFSITNATHRQNATNALINSLSEGTSDPQDNDFYVAQYAGGGTTTTTYHRRPIKALFNYLKSKWTYRTDGSTSKIKININSTSNWMLCFTVTLYQGYRAIKVMVSGYQYGSNHWYQPEARLIGDSDGTETISVYFGYDSTNNLWVGFDGGNYTGVRISDVVNGYKAVSNWHSLFTISNVSSLATLQTTVTASSRANYAVSAGSCTGNSATASFANYTHLLDTYSSLIRPTTTSSYLKISDIVSSITGYSSFNSHNYLSTSVMLSSSIEKKLLCNGYVAKLDYAIVDISGYFYSGSHYYVIIKLYDQTGVTDNTYPVLPTGSLIFYTSQMNEPIIFCGNIENNNNKGRNANSVLANAITYYNANGPSISGVTDGALFEQYYNDSWIAQMAIDYRTGRAYFRGKNNGTWKSWLTNIDSGNIGSQSVNNAAKLGNIAVQTTSIGGTTTETGEHWSYVKKAKFTTTGGYIVYSNGLTIQWTMGTTTSTTASTGIKLPVAFSSASTYSAVGIKDHFEGGYNQMFECKKVDGQYVKVRCRGTTNHGSSTGNEYERAFSLICIGY